MAELIVSNSSPLTPSLNFTNRANPTKAYSLQFTRFYRPNRLVFSSSLVKIRAQKSTAMATETVQEVLPPALDSTSDPPPLFDGTTRLYISYICPYAQRVWIARNCKGLQDKIKLVPIDLQNRPAWYKEKVYSENKVTFLDEKCIIYESLEETYIEGRAWAMVKCSFAIRLVTGLNPENSLFVKKSKVPALEHNNEVRGESLDLIKYVDSHFEGPELLPDDPAKREFAEEILSYTDTFNSTVITSFKGDAGNEVGAPFDYLENALSKFDDGPYFLGQFSLVDIAYAPFIERYQPFLLDVKNYDITEGRPKLAAWIQDMNKIEGYTVTKRDPQELVERYKKRFLAQF